MAFSIKDLDAPLGAAIHDVDLTGEVDETSFDAINRALDERSLVVLHAQKIGAEHLVRFARRFGELLIHPQVKTLVPGHPELMIVSNIIENGRHIGSKDAGKVWHTDGSYLDHPDRYTFLYGIEIPHDNERALGNTLFASTAAAYDALPDATKRRIDKLKAVHSFKHHSKTRAEQPGGTRLEVTEDLLKKQPDKAQPMVRTHPETGRKCLYVTVGHTTHVVGMDAKESEQLLNELWEHIARPEFIYAHHWQVGDLVIWDNAATQHRATFDYALPQRRLMYRTATVGTVPF
jgi:taurine dioxygenase